MLITQPLTTEAITDVYANLWHKEQMTADEILFAKSFYEKNKSSNTFKALYTSSGILIAIWCVYPKFNTDSNFDIYTAFTAKSTIENYWLPVTKYIKKSLNNISKHTKATNIYLQSNSTFQEVHDWYLFLGFDKLGTEYNIWKYRR